ncbi:anti-sigma factor antagonist [Streptomyces sp. NPDC087300]|uniref:anti-sigma factor antagonist n=1 Tax=Streptomyces sp. NPDC087300 TaxID=3365780 RepID=UPI003818330C
MPEPAHSQQPLAGGRVEHAEGGHPTVPLPGPPTARVPGGGRRVMIVRGELDLDVAQRLRPDLCVALNHAAAGIDLDLRDIDFCDCSGLNVLLGLRQQALRMGKNVVISVSSPAVDRVLELTGTRALFRAWEENEAEDEAEVGNEAGSGEVPGACPTVHETSRPEPDQDLHMVVAQLRRAMLTRPTIDLARGILMSSFSLSPEAAWEVLVTASQNTNTKLYVLAEDVVSTVRGSALPDAVRKQLEAAVARTTAAYTGADTRSLTDLAVVAVDPCSPPDDLP